MGTRRRRLLVLAGTLLGLLPAAGELALRLAARDLRPAADVTDEPVALVLGAQMLPGGRPSRFLLGRLETARRLHAAGSVRRVLVSGDDRSGSNHEATGMRDWLVQHGVPASEVDLDPRGYDTHDSCWNALHRDGHRRLVVVSQTYHLPRALLTCRLLGISAVGVGDDSVAGSRVWRTGQWRERVALLKLVLDLLPGRAFRDGAGRS